MHQAAIEYLAEHATDDFLEAIDIGGRETNGHARYLWPNAHWTVVDAVDGPGVNIVADGRTYKHLGLADLVLFAEVAEHTPFWRDIIDNIRTMLKADGMCLMTMAGPGREVHGLYHDDPNEPGWYRNIQPHELHDALDHAGFDEWQVDQLGTDVRAWAIIH